MRRFFFIADFIFILFMLIFSGCSLKYGSNVNTEASIPEFIFSGASFFRYEDGDKTMTMNAGTLEQYKDGHSTYAKDVEFTTYSKEGKLETEGSCNYLGADTDAKLYEMHENIKIHNEKHEMDVAGKNLKWNGKTEQLTSGRNDMVKIEKDGTLIMGSGFSASGVSSEFTFTGAVSGEIETKDDKDKNEESDSEITAEEGAGDEE